MKTMRTQEVTVCDGCGGTDAWYSCLGCGKDFCGSCCKTNAVTYHHAVYFQGSGDGVYCIECNLSLLKKRDPTLMAYLVIKRLKDELAGFHADFEKRHKEAEEHLRSLQK